MEPVNRLTLETIDDVIDGMSATGSQVLDLRAVRFADPFALLMVHLLLLRREEEARPARCLWPQTSSVRRWMDVMGVAPRGTSAASSLPRDAASALQPITRIEEELEISRVVDGFNHCLTERYPLTEGSRRALIAFMIELFQNIPHHSNATGTIADPHGIAAMQDYEDSLFLAVADVGVGLSASLGLRDGYRDLSDASALDVVLHQGISRFSDPGRGGELRRIAEVVRSWDGMFALRTGRALYYFDPLGGDIYDVPAFPGVQLGLRLPRHALLQNA